MFGTYHLSNFTTLYTDGIIRCVVKEWGEIRQSH